MKNCFILSLTLVINDWNTIHGRVQTELRGLLSVHKPVKPHSPIIKILYNIANCCNTRLQDLLYAYNSNCVVNTVTVEAMHCHFLR